MAVVIVILISSVVLTVMCFAVLSSEARDKAYRRENSLPVRRYYDVSDYDVHEVYTTTFTSNRSR